MLHARPSAGAQRPLLQPLPSRGGGASVLTFAARRIPLLPTGGEGVAGACSLHPKRATESSFRSGRRVRVARAGGAGGRRRYPPFDTPRIASGAPQGEGECCKDGNPIPTPLIPSRRACAPYRGAGVRSEASGEFIGPLGEPVQGFVLFPEAGPAARLSRWLPPRSCPCRHRTGRNGGRSHGSAHGGRRRQGAPRSARRRPRSAVQKGKCDRGRAR